MYRLRQRRALRAALAGAALVALSRAAPAHAANIVWNGGTGVWGTGTNWVGGSAPGATDTAVFSASTTACSIGSSISVAAISISVAVTITQSAGATVTTTGNVTQSAGTFNGGNSAITIGGDLALSGTGTFKASSATTEIRGAFNKTGGTFTHNSGTVMLTASTSKTLASHSTTFNNLVINDGLVGYWKLDETSAGTAADASGYATTGTDLSSPTASSTVPSTLSFASARSRLFSKASQQAVDMGVMPTQLKPTSALTLSAWFKGSATDGGNTDIISGGDVYVLRITDTQAQVHKHKSGAWVPCSANASPVPIDNNWHHIAGTISSSTMVIYYDGVAIGTCSDSNALVYDQGTHLYVGRHGNGGTWADADGNIDDVRIYNRALAATEIYALYTGYQPATATATQTLTGTPTVAGDLVIASGGLSASTNAITVGGSWLNYGAPFTGTGTITFNGSGSGNLIRTSSWPFSAMTVSGSGSWTLDDRLWVPGGTITLSGGTLAGGSAIVHAGTIATSGGAFTPGTSTVVLDGTSNQTLGPTAFGGLRIEDPTETNLVGYWKLDDIQGTTFRDSSGNGNRGTLVNGPAWVMGSASLPTMAIDDPSAISLDGSNDYATLGVTNLPALNASMTVAFWAYYASVPGSSQDMLALKASSNLLQIGFYNISGATLLRAWNGGGTIRVTASSTPSSGWHHVAFSYNGTTSKLYVDGGTPATSSVAPLTGAITAAYLGTYNAGSELFNGRLDDVRIYSTALTDAQVAALAAGRYPNAGGTATVTLGANTTVSGTLALDSGNLSTSSYTLNASSASSVASVAAGTYTVGSATSTFAGGLTVQPLCALTMATSGGAVSIGSGKTLTMNGTLTASSTGSTIQSAGGNGTSYTFSVGTTSTATPALNISGLAVKNTDTDGMYINTHTSATTTFTRFDNIAFSNGTGNDLLRIYSPSLYLTSSGCTFDSGQASGSTTYAVKLAGNGTADGETRALFGGSSCATNRTPCSSYKQDDDANADGVGDNAGSNAAVVQFVRAGSTDTSGTIEGFPVAAFDWSTFSYYSTYVTFHDVDGGTADRVYVRDANGTAKYSWDAPSSEDLVGSPRFDTSGGVHYVYVATTAGKVYRLIDSGSTLSADNTGFWAGANPYDCGCTITTPLTLFVGNLYWGGTLSGNQKVWTLGASSRTLASGSPMPIGATIVAATPAFWISTDTYMFMGMNAHFYKVNVTAQSGTTDNTNPTGNVRGRIVISNSKVYGGDDGGTMWALDPSNFANAAKLWSYHDNTNHNGCSSGVCSIKASAYVDYASGEVFYGDQDGHVYAIQSGGSARSGFPYRPGSLSDTFMTAPLYRSGIIGIGTSDGNLYFIDRDTGAGSPGLAQSYRFGTGQKISGIGFDNASSSYLVSVANDTNKDGKIYYLPAVSDPTPSAQ